jgi:hypothetical protein
MVSHGGGGGGYVTWDMRVVSGDIGSKKTTAEGALRPLKQASSKC